MSRTGPNPDREGRDGTVAAALVASVAASIGAVAALVLRDSISQDPAGSVAGIALVCAVTGVAGLAAGRLLVSRPAEERVQAANRRALASRRARRDDRHDRASLRELRSRLADIEDETTALATIGRDLQKCLPDHSVELHLVDRVDPALVLAVATSRPASSLGERTSPWDSAVCANGETLVVASTQDASTCLHLRARAPQPVSAIAVPLTALGQILGVLYVFGPHGEAPGEAEIGFIEDLTAVLSDKIALIRAGDTMTRVDALDRLTGLPDRASTQAHVIRLLRDRVPLSVAVADIDAFDGLGRDGDDEAGKRALRLLARLARSCIRPTDIVGRIGADQLLFVMPRTSPEQAARVLERLREEIVISRATSGAPTFSLSVGLVGSHDDLSIEAMLRAAADALRQAQDLGGDHIVRAALSGPPDRRAVT
ncbi:MAG: diguanylate cyclase [Acidimicrobiales bacterium]